MKFYILNFFEFFIRCVRSKIAWIRFITRFISGISRRRLVMRRFLTSCLNGWVIGARDLGKASTGRRILRRPKFYRPSGQYRACEDYRA